jgi:hydroxymethylpyrimidine pyrophosphatase-like HAD family hydrolase
MLEYTKESIAMGNSNPVIFDHVTYKTTDINDDGVYNALKHFELF